MDGRSNGDLRTVCDYVHLNPVRAKLIAREDRLLAYPWSSLKTETIPSIPRIAVRLHPGSAKSAKAKLAAWMKAHTGQSW